MVAPPSAQFGRRVGAAAARPARRVFCPDRRARTISDRGGWSPATFKTIIDAGFDVITYARVTSNASGPQRSPSTPTSTRHRVEYTYTAGETTTTFDLGKDGLVLRQIHKQPADGTQVERLSPASVSIF